MAQLNRVKVEWSGSAITGGGTNSFYFAQAATGFVSDVRNFYTGIAGAFPTGVTWSVPSTGDIIDDATGDIVGTWADGTAGSFSGTGTGGSWAAGVGCRVVWVTAGRRSNRLVRGSTFLVPLLVGAYDTDGTITAGYISTLNAAATALFTGTSGDMRIWSRPHAGASDGTSHVVIGNGVADKVSSLRSRRV